jgi:plastocyanin
VTRQLTKPRIAPAGYQLRGAALRSPLATVAVPSELDSVVIYPNVPAKRTSPPVLASVAQRDTRFSAPLLVVPVGARVSFPNDDPIFHNVYSLSKTKSFDLGYFPKGQTRVVTFDQPGVVDVFCHLHAQMSTSIVVVPSASWTQPDGSGDFTLKDVPDGEVEIVAWHRAAGFFRRRVVVLNGQPSEPLQFVIPIREK